MKNASHSARQCPHWCDAHSYGDGSLDIHRSTEVEIALANESHAAGVAIHQSMAAGVVDHSPAVWLYQDITTDGVKLTADEAIKLGAELIRHGETIKYADDETGGRLQLRSNLSVEAWRDHAASVAAVFARIDLDRLMDHIDDEARRGVGGTLTDLVTEAGLSLEYGIGAKIVQAADHILRDGCLVVGIEAAQRHCGGRPDLKDSAIRLAMVLAGSTILAEAVEAADACGRG